MDQANTEEPRVPARTYGTSVGQIAEWLVWTRLVATSFGDLHVFLPLKDQGVDGIVHRISTDEFARVQVKGRRHRRGGIQFGVQGDELIDDRAVVVAVEVDQEAIALGATALLVDVPTFRERATLSQDGGTPHYSAYVHFPPRPNEPWSPWCVSLADLGERLLPTAAPPIAPAVVAEAVRADWASAGHLGYRAEMELLRRASDSSRLNAFKAFPDLEPNEYLIYDLVSRGIAGIQVKAVTLGSDGEATLNVYRPALRPSAKTWFVLFVAEQGGRFGDHCAVMPSRFVAEHLVGHGINGYFSVSRGLPGRLAPWRVPMEGLGSRLAELAAALA